MYIYIHIRSLRKTKEQKKVVLDLYDDDVYLNRIQLQQWGYKNYLPYVKYGAVKISIDRNSSRERNLKF
jgi:hypothetical protein